MKKMDAYRLNVKKIENGNHIYIGGIAGVVRIITDFSPQTDLYQKETRLEVESFRYRSWALPVLAFIFEKGLIIDKALFNENQYFGMDYGYRGKSVTLDKNKFNKKDFKRVADYLISLDSSRSRKKRIKKLKLVNTLKAYNEALLLNLNRVDLYNHSEQSSLNFIRLLDSLVVGSNAWDFSNKVVKCLSDEFIQDHYAKIQRNKLFRTLHIPTAENIFQVEKDNIKFDLEEYKRSKACRLFLITLFSVYQFRNKWIHNCFPFPTATVTYDDASKYFGFSLGSSLPIKDSRGAPVFNNLNYIDYGDLLLEIAPSPPSHTYQPDYKKLYILWPTWFFLNLIVRELLKNELKIK